MRYKKLCCLVFLFIAINSFSQSAVDVEDITKLSIVAPGLSYEKRTGKLQTLHVQAFMSANFGIGYSSSLGNTSFFYASPAVGLQYRYYYNAAGRERKGKRTEMNSMNYIAPLYTMVLTAWSISKDYYGEDKRRPVHSLGLVWGIQRNYINRFSLDMNAGPGLAFANNTLYDQNLQPVSKKIASSFELQAQIRIGLWLNRQP